MLVTTATKLRYKIKQLTKIMDYVIHNNYGQE